MHCHAWVYRLFAWVFALMTSAELFPWWKSPNWNSPVMCYYFQGRRRLSAILKVQISSGIPHHHPQMPWLSYSQTRILTVRKSSHIRVFGGILKFRQRWKQTWGIFPVPPIPNFILAEVLTKSSTLKQLPTFGLGLGSRSEKRGHISCFLALPVAKKCFPDPRRSCYHVTSQIFIAEELFHKNFGHQFRFSNWC